MLATGALWIWDFIRMVVRDCYVTLADKVFDGVTRIALVLGMKGIGKPVFINYLMVRIGEKYRASNEALPDCLHSLGSLADDIIKHAVGFSAVGVLGLRSWTTAVLRSSARGLGR
jgi:hypothetical protein